MARFFTLLCTGLILWVLCFIPAGAQKAQDQNLPVPDLQELFESPPGEAGTWVYWWWLNGYVSKDAIVRELDEFKDKGISGAIIFHAGNGSTPAHTPFMSEQWREYFRFAVDEAAKRGITITLNICEGWNAGGPWVTPEHASASLQHTKILIEGPLDLDTLLPDLSQENHRRELFTYAWRLDGDACDSESWIDISSAVNSNGALKWHVPEGDWILIRFGTFVSPMGYTKLTNDSEWFSNRYFETNEMDQEGMKIHFDHTAKILIDDVKQHAGKTLTHLHIDSGETGHPDWTQGFYDHFKRLRAYDARKFMAAKADHIIDNEELTERFLEDYKLTQGDLIIEAYYGGLQEKAEQYGMGAHSEAAGYQKPNVDALRAMGVNDIAMSEFWSRTAKNYIHQASQEQLAYHDGIRNAASAGHIYGRKIVQAEAFTNMGWMNFSTPLYELKDIGDRAFCQGLNRMVLCFLVHQPEGKKTFPGYAWPYVGTCFNVNATWWDWSGEWIDYLNRCHALLQTGRFVADACYFQGEWVPSYVPAKWLMDPSLPEGYDADVINADILTRQTEVNEKGELVLSSGMTYRYLVLNQGGRWQNPPGSNFNKVDEEPLILEWPDIASGKPLAISPTVMRRIKTLVQEGVTLVGPPPDRAIGLSAYPESDKELATLVNSLWGTDPGPSGQHAVGKGRVIWGKKLSEIMIKDGLVPDLEYIEDEETVVLPLSVETASRIPDPIGFDWIHRQSDGADYYYLTNPRNEEAGGAFFFRQNSRQPELWDPVTGEIRDLYEYHITADGRLAIPLNFAPRQSCFIVFRLPLDLESHGILPNYPSTQEIIQMEGEWTVGFDSSLGGPEQTVFHELRDWTKSENDHIRYYSGKARYSKEFKVARKVIKREPNKRIMLDLGQVEVMARVYLNGQELGTLWTAPWQVNVTGALKPGKNKLEIEVVNLWRNRLIGDRDLPVGDQITKSNVLPLQNEELFPSGLMGPVQLISYE